MQADNVTVVWGLALVFLALMGVMIALMYFADRRPKTKRKRASSK